MSDIFDVKDHHGDIPEILNHMDLEPLAAETIERQQGMWKLWQTQKDLFHQRLLWNEEKLKGWKVDQLCALVDWAYSTSPFYNSLYNKAGYEPGAIRSLDDFAKLPTIGKDDVIANFPTGMPSREFDIKSCRWMSSSGSSGKQVQIVLPQNRADLDILFKYRMFEWQGDFRLDPGRWLYNIHYVLWWHTSILGNLPVFSVTQECPPEAVLRHIAFLRPQVVSSLGSYLAGLAALGQSLDQYGVRVVSTNSETTTQTERSAWEEIFCVPVRDEYSSEEIDILAVQCNAGRYHVLEDDVHVEVINPDSDGFGEVVGTDLWNRAMPMIRYRQGDLATLSPYGAGDLCACGSHFRKLDQLHGRADQAFITMTGQRIVPGRLLDVVEAFLCREDAQVLEFRVVQKDYDKVDLLFIPKGPTNADQESIIQEFHRKLEELFGHAIHFNSVRLGEIPPLGSFKRRTVISEVGGLD